MGAAEHRIGRVVFEIAAADSGDLERFGGMLRARFDAVVLPALQTALDRSDRPGGLIRLGRVEVDLGTLGSAAPSAQEFARRLTEGLAAALRAAPVRDDAAELIAFLETGELPWTEPGRALATAAAALMSLDGTGMARLAARLRVALIRRRTAERLVGQLPAVLVRRILRALLPDVLAAPLTVAFGPDGAEEGIAAPVSDALVPSLTETILRLARGTTLPDLGETIALYTALDGRAPAPLPPAALLAAQEGAVPELAAMDASPAPQEPDETQTAVDAAARPVYAAGAVLLHPFLGTLFERFGLLDASGGFRNRAARGRAVLLVHHIATGAEEAPEPETTLFKLLCGMALEDFIPRRLVLTDAERAEIHALLTSVIEHWQRLGSTSPAALREGFLTRPGRLEHRAGIWHLSVEPRGIDVLLDGLPWTLSRVKTPFMDTLLIVDWR